MTLTHQPRGMYFEDFQIGQQVVTQGRTITESDIVTFAGLSADYNQIHTDAVYSATAGFGARVAHGMLVASIVSGLAVLTGILEGTIMAFREILEWKFSKPVFIGDTVHAILEVTDTKPAGRLGGGRVEIKVTVKNQNGETVMGGKWAVLMKSKPGA
jgi:acyl dehydratase